MKVNGTPPLLGERTDELVQVGEEGEGERGWKEGRKEEKEEGDIRRKERERRV